MAADIKKVLSRVTARVLIYLFNQENAMCLERVLEACADAELGATERTVRRNLEDLVRVGVLTKFDATALSGKKRTLYSLTKEWRTSSSTKTNGR